jgi:hypothetical protein
MLSVLRRVLLPRTADRTADRTIEVVVHDPSICAGFARNAESRMNMRTTYPTDREYQPSNNVIPIVVF